MGNSYSLLIRYRKIPNVSSGLIAIFKHILGGLYSGGAHIRRAFCVSICVSTILKSIIISIKYMYIYIYYAPVKVFRLKNMYLVYDSRRIDFAYLKKALILFHHREPYTIYLRVPVANPSHNLVCRILLRDQHFVSV